MTTILNSCWIGAGTHGSIESFYFNYSKEEIVSIVDEFLIANPEYYSSVEESFGWIYIKTPSSNEKFGFRIGEGEINLISAGKENEPSKWEAKLGRTEKQKFIENFEHNFLDKLKGIAPTKVKLLKRPFILSFNLDPDTTLWPHYVFKNDTLLTYPLPNEIDSTNIDVFKDIVLSFAKNTNQNIAVIQYYNIFRINKDYSGYIGDSLYITAYYRVIGQKKNYNTIFNHQNWSDYISETNIIKREKDVKDIRTERVEQGYAVTDVYSELSEELWMLNNNKLKIKNGK